jgi:serine/threonine protein kinase
MEVFSKHESSVYGIMILQRGDKINDTYEVLFFIGKGAFGEVYRVRHKYLDVQIIKVLNPDYVENTNIEEVIQEAKLLSCLNHSNIVRIFECNTFNKESMDFFFISMEFVSGETLAQLLKRTILLPLDVALHVQSELLLALQCVHTHTPPIVHGDISPDNILLDYSIEPFQIKLTDFGLARYVDPFSHLSNAAGKYTYMAPECFHNVYLPSSDVFSAGVVFYQMCTGLHPWPLVSDISSTSKEALLDESCKSRRTIPVKPSYITNNDELIVVDDIIMLSLGHELDQRYLNASEFLESLNLIKL